MPNLYHGGPVETIGSRWRRSVPKNVTQTKSKNRAKDMAIQKGMASVLFGRQRVRVKEVEWIDRIAFRECKTRKSAKTLALLFLETTVFKCNGKFWVRCI